MWNYDHVFGTTLFPHIEFRQLHFIFVYSICFDRKFPKSCLLDHTWIAHRWIPDLGLSQHKSEFENNLVDGRILNLLSKKEMEKHLGIHRKFHQASILHAIELLRRLNYDKEVCIIKM